ncbi:putative membrane protein [Erwinia phage pEa_SNUABM_50]|uniref:Uncharacterized protein n=4 Tax=Eneladusvirus BF TaxID=2560751 RepID=A0A1S6UB26_9CAUD|nr:membrane protein [Serratia phage BF]QOI71052.1 putative membrane protein [Erwinia phage pEa_SNUABM_12]QOI71597.1 putative membrane protein [Erwinia phage pEa_SNUABM_47]QOI72136.1 putative membrane protein [Erwinia phage pEa_SNUABM_50]QXO11261.1 hypothetical protein pEaSNUABM19_00115 [Erwinia phage pEa_SNUABM_19]QXO11809.1 hypothetical protein pEaSNUABM44_00113 [Erwinia phage pEa_SNUABM_44]QXO12361.1 hypothetical protein pEaSNUABM49_00115 [Erwinia phage pEa_SNUABM_49]
MKRMFWSALLAAFIVWVISWAVTSGKSTEHQNVYYNTGQIVALGQCKGGECSYQYKDNTGSLQYATSSKPVSLGQLVYQECWYEEAKGDRCYVEYQPSKN